MARIHDLSSQVIDYAERMSAMADAAQGKRRHRGRMTRWLLLPASGAALYAVVRSDSFSRGAKGVVDEAKTKASELPDDLVARVRDTSKSTGSSRSSNGSSTSKSSGTKRRTSSGRTRSTSSRKKTAASSR